MLNRPPPILIRNFIDNPLLGTLQRVCERLRRFDGSEKIRDEEYQRISYHNHTLVKVLHDGMVLERAIDIFKENLKTSYSLISLYDESKSHCPIHVDRPQCYKTIDLCINQKVVWPLYVTSGLENAPTIEEVLQREAEFKLLGKPYLMEPGDALCFSGTDDPHWRNQIDKGNFCDLVFFHFVKDDFKDSLF